MESTQLAGNIPVKLTYRSQYQHILARNNILQSILSVIHMQERERILTVVCVMHITVNN